MKRIVTLLLLCILIFTFAGCESQADKDKKAQEDEIRRMVQPGPPPAPVKKGDILNGK